MTIFTDLSRISGNQQFTSITADSRRVQSGALFLAYPGAHSDGRNYIPQAIQAGAAAVVWEKQAFTWNPDWQVSNLGVDGLRPQVGQVAAEYYQHPSGQLTMIGVTGTNGKTSVSQWLAQCLTLLGQKAAVLGTIGNGFVDAESGGLAESANTTPDAVLLQGMLADFVQQHAKAAVMEVSSHGIEQGRVNGVAFKIAVLTNLTRDHLDYHQTMQAYAAAKQKLFDWPSLNIAVLNADEIFGQTIADSLKQQTKSFVTYGLLHGEVRGSDLQLHQQGLSMQVTTPQGNATLHAPVLGRFNAYNVLAVLASLLALKVSLTDAVAALGQIKPVQGRMQRFGGHALPLVVIDYAHTPDALENVLLTLKEQKPAKLICVFGCGGNRDAGKRPLMGAVASKWADTVIVTSDNPRNENAIDIINEVVRGITTTCLVEPDRTLAINQAIQTAQQGDIVLVAGKGHEDYQEIAGVKYPFSDAVVAQAALASYATQRLGVSS